MSTISAKRVLNAREYIKFWFKIKGLTAREAVRNACLSETMYLDYEDLYHQYRFKNPDFKARMLPFRTLEQALTEYITTQLAEEVLKAADDLLVESEDLRPLKKWVKAVTGSEDEKDVAIVAHWIWCVKRKATGQPVVYHIMPILYGEQGGGKTVALEKLIGPLLRFRLNISMPELNDTRVYNGLAQNYIVLFDELQGAARVDMNALKKQITTIDNSYRKLHTHNVITAPQRCSFIGATNKPVAENLTDSTGMRRFWEINALPKLDWEHISSINYAELWRGVDETRERGYLTDDMLQKVYSAQQEMVNHDDLDVFVLDMLIKPSSAEISEITHAQLFDAYLVWAGRNNIASKLNAIWFGRKMSRKLTKLQKKNDRGQNVVYYVINSESLVLDSTTSSVVSLRKGV